MAFGLGRPDTLGMDDYHSRKPSEIGTSESSIIPCMVFFSQIVRKVSVRIYSSNLPWQEKLHDAGEIQNELDVWVENLPLTIKPDTTIMETALQFTLREPKWCRRQRLITRLSKPSYSRVILRANVMS
jgi:hypothetical protein